MNRSKKFRPAVCAALALLMFLLAFGGAGCANTPTNENTTAAVTTALPDTIAKILPVLPDNHDYGGYTFTFLDTGNGYGFGYYQTVDVYSEQETGETLNDAVYKRNTDVETELNIKIAEYQSDHVLQDAKTAIKAGDTSFDAIFTDMNESATMAQSKYLLDIKNMPVIDLSQPWWDQNATTELSIINKLFFTTGDIDTMVKACTRMLIFNKKLLQDFSLDDPYQHVKDNTWTFDVYSQMVKAVHMDVNGNGINDDDDIYGAIMDNGDPLTIIRGFGTRLTANDASGIPQITFDNTATYDQANKIYGLYYDGNACRNETDMTQSSAFSNVYTYARSLFASDKFLFHLGVPLILSEFRDMPSDFGLLPCPKYDTNQSRYYHTVDPQAVVLSIPITCQDQIRTGTVLEAMAAESMYTTAPAYNEIMLKRKFARDDESAFVLDIINQTRTYDLCTMYNWGGLGLLMYNLTQKKSTDLSSAVAKTLSSAQTAINKTVSAFQS